MASTSNIEILGRFQLKYLRMIVDVPWYVLNMVKEDIRHYSSQYGAHFSTQPNYY
jgi:hypothetical protein